MSDPARTKAPDPAMSAADDARDRPRETACNSRDQRLEDDLKKISARFGWLDGEAQRRLETLRRELQQKDAPNWSDDLMDGVVGLALASGIAGAAEYLASEAIEKSANVTRAFFKKAFEQGLKDGEQAGKNRMGSVQKQDLDGFMDVQEHAVATLHMKNQDRFVDFGRHEIVTPEQSQAVLDTFSDENLDRAAQEQHDATRDAWISLLAQEQFGSSTAKSAGPDGTVSPSTTTNMMTQERRDWVNKDASHFVPDKAPSFMGAVQGEVPGVLEILLELPNIVSGELQGSPGVKFALLDGVNETVRKQYAGRPLAELRIPRQLTAEIDSGFPDFVVNLDERGVASRVERPEWLRAFALAGHPERASRDGYELMMAGLERLLANLVAPEIA